MFHTTFYLRRLHSLVGLLAIGIFLFEHIITNARALGGAESLNGALAMMELIPHPIFLGLEIFGVALPILFHAIYGIYIALQAKNNPAVTATSATGSSRCSAGRHGSSSYSSSGTYSICASSRRPSMARQSRMSSCRRSSRVAQSRHCSTRSVCSLLSSISAMVSRLSA